jgi:lantibiotic modifying enzyme
MEERNKHLADWAQAYLDDNSIALPRDTKTEIAIVGEAFSEFAARRGELLSCKARVELRAIDIKSGKVLSIEKRTETAVDIAEQIAAKSALQKAAQEVSLTFIPGMVKNWQRE